ncbi:unnamed protein product [Brassicogethes aeneus]|uniref:Uncharacterized protein n=1 Tax=Brassicogethes aeneus TaxID=1431903 RepID=A0A9P0BDT1_BRAAE|nr:unnamed protein product [Brassicogethes aeneus]
MNAVKQERHDEAEIQELAAKLVEANKAKMANPARPPPPPVTSMNILSFLTSDKAKTSKLQNSVSLTTVTETNKTVDEDSVRGKFGWTSLGKVHIPFIIRSGEHYCSVRMVEMKVLNKLLNFLHQDLYNCTNIRSYYITESEARLLNEINFKHCDYQFGREQFTTRDLIVRLADANEFYQFLGHCYNKLVSAVEADSLDRCGFIRINRESVVPYTVYNEQKYVPLFYFEGETDNLKQRADKLEGWDLSYLKFCCKVQGIRNELFAHDSCSVISLNDIKNYFPPGTLFEDYWPKKNLDSQLLISGNSRSQAQIVQWTRKPTAPPMPSHPPPSPKPATQAKAANNSQLHNVHVYSNYNIGAASATGGQPPYHSPQPRTASSAVRATYPSAATRNMRPSTSYYASMAQAPPALVRSTAQASYTNAQTNSGASNYMILDPSINQTNFHQPSQLNKYPPPPLLHMNGAIPSPYDRYLFLLQFKPNPNFAKFWANKRESDDEKLRGFNEHNAQLDFYTTGCVAKDPFDSTFWILCPLHGSFPTTFRFINNMHDDKLGDIGSYLHKCLASLRKSELIFDFSMGIGEAIYDKNGELHSIICEEFNIR